jgi:hypothetical protein
MPNNRCIDTLLIVALASFVSISLPISCIVISDYMDTREYSEGTCNGTTLSNYTVEGSFFFHGRVNVVAQVNGTQYHGYLYYPPIEHWQLGAMPQDGVDDWYDSLNKTGDFQCFVNLKDPAYPMVNKWIEITGYHSMFILCLVIMAGWVVIAFLVQNSKQERRGYIPISDELPPPYTPLTVNRIKQQSLYSSLNDELTTISF